VVKDFLVFPLSIFSFNIEMRTVYLMFYFIPFN
jgi:hypothetical protein